MPLPASGTPAVPSFTAASGSASISIIIPTYNEATGLSRLLTYLHHHTAAEAAVDIVVADGGSTDHTRALAQQAGVRVVQSPRKGRAAQLNYGARHASGAVLYLLHADSYPPPGFVQHLRQALHQGYPSGCYRLAFDHPHWFLQISAWCTRLPLTALRFGDQSLFVRRELFEQVGGFREELQLMEDQDLVRRLRARAPFKILPAVVVTSARKYLTNGVLRLQATFALLVGLYWLGVPQPRLVRLYRALIRQDKL